VEREGKQFRNRSRSLGEYYNNQVMLANVKDNFGKGMWENSNYESDKGLVGPLKIVRLPSDRSIPMTLANINLKSVNFNSAIQSLRGSIKSPMNHEDIDDNPYTVNNNTYFSFAKKSQTPMMSNRQSIEGLLGNTNNSFNNTPSKQKAKLKLPFRFGEQNINILIKGNLTSKNKKKIDLPNKKMYKFDDLLPKIEENSISDKESDKNVNNSIDKVEINSKKSKKSKNKKVKHGRQNTR
jgi:hypothetical protein